MIRLDFESFDYSWMDRVNNLRHQHGDMHIAATVTSVRIYDNIMKSA